MGAKCLGRLAFAAVSLILAVGICCADESTATARAGCFRGVELLTGYGLGNTGFKGHYKLTPVFVDLDFDLKNSCGLTRILPGVFDFVLEPFASYVYRPDENAEAGTNFMLKIGLLPETWKFQPYFKGGAGLMYMSQHLKEQSTQFNFGDSAAFGANFFIRNNIAVTVEYRFRHVSNAGIKTPNHGINTGMTLCGLSYIF